VVGAGTTFTMLFPACESSAIVPAVETKTVTATGAGKTILVVDDEPLIRNLLNDVLAGNGHHILVAENGAVALKLFKQHMAEISLVMIDMMMPVLDGYKTIGAMQRLRPGTPFIAMSGMLQPAKLTEAAPEAKIELLNKPFTVPQVFETLARIR
jgi:CheY-like chemotaxis protein